MALPILLNLTGKQVVVVGGGAVGLRKLAALRAAGAAVRVIDPRTPLALPPDVEQIAEAYRAEYLDGVSLAFACATPEVNAMVVADCRRHGIWVNSASDPVTGDCALPAVVRRGELTLAVSTGRAAPALARRIRAKWESEFDQSFAEWIRVLADVRSEVLATVADESRRRTLLNGFADWHWLARLRAEGTGAVLVAMRAEIHQPPVTE